jgi:hypothetical protein
MTFRIVSSSGRTARAGETATSTRDAGDLARVDPAGWSRISDALLAEARAIGTAIGTAAGLRARNVSARNVSARNDRGPNALRYSSAAWDASAAAWTLASLIDLLGEEAAESEQAGFLRGAIAALQQFIEAEQAEIGTPADVAATAAESTSVSETISVTAWAAGIRTRRHPALRQAIAAYDLEQLRRPAYRDAADDAWVAEQLAKRTRYIIRMAAEHGVDPDEALRMWGNRAWHAAHPFGGPVP